MLYGRCRFLAAPVIHGPVAGTVRAHRWHRIDGTELIRQGRWCEKQANLAEAEMGAARSASGSCWVGPTVLESRPAPHSELLNR